MDDYNAFKTGGRELAVDTPDGQYRFAVEVENDIVLIPPEIMRDGKIRRAIQQCSEVDGLFNHDAISPIREP